MAGSSRTFASEFLDNHNHVRAAVTASDQYAKWIKQFPSVYIDGIKFYLTGGGTASDTGSESLAPVNPGADQPQEEDEMILSWARSNGLVSDEDLEGFSAP
jgi:hypothetical protein